MKNQKESKAMTWQKLKDFCNSLPESELEKEVITQGAEVSHKIMFAECIDDDWVDNGDVGCSPKQEFIDNAIPTMTQEEIDDLRIVVPKGTAFLFTNEY